MLPSLPGASRPLAPMRLSEILETVTSLYRANARTVVALTALIAVPAYLVSVLVGRSLVPLAERLSAANPLAADPAASLVLVGDAAALMALSFAIVAIDQVAISLVAAALALSLGRPGEPALSAAATLRRLGPSAIRLIPALVVILASILALVLALVVLLVPVTLAFGTTLAAGGAGAFFTLLVAVGVAATSIFLLVRWSITAPVVALEGAGPVAALGRSWRLVAGSTWRVLGYGVLMGVVVIILDLTFVQTVAAVASTVAPGLVTPIEIGLGALAQALLVPLGALLSLVLYHDLRLRGGSAVRPGAPGR